MDNRKTYVRPAVESEVMMEQTSLACNMIMKAGDPDDVPICGPTNEHDPCWLPFVKGGVWWLDICGSEKPYSFDCPIQYS